MEDLLDGDVLKAMLTEAIKEGAEKAFGPGASAVANCVPGAGDLAHRIASKLATLLASALTALQLPWQLQMVELLSSWVLSGHNKESILIIIDPSHGNLN